MLALLRDCSSYIVLALLAFCSLYLTCGEDGGPGGALFALLTIYILALAAGTAIGYTKQLPPLLGMLVAGFALRNLPYVGEHVGAKVNTQWSSVLRLVALVLILCRAGLAIDLKALRRLRFVVARLAALPCLCEAAVAAGLAAWLLEFPIAWACMLGFVVAAISPAVVVPSLLSLQERGYGVSTGIPTLVVASAPLDDVLAIAGFGISLGLGEVGSGDKDQNWITYARAPLEVVFGVAAGVLGALVVVLLTPAHAFAPADASGEDATAKDASAGRERRLLLLLGTAITSAFGLKRAQYSGAAALSLLILGAGVARGWAAAAKPVAAVLAELWNRLAQPLLFGLVGASVVVDTLEPRLVGIGIAILIIGGLVRAMAVMTALMGQGLRRQDRLFTAMAWMPKATVQAAIGGAALDEAVTPREKEMGRQLLAVAILAILITAPLGALLISILGPKMLERTPESSGSTSSSTKDSGEAATDAAKAENDVKVVDDEQAEETETIEPANGTAASHASEVQVLAETPKVRQKDSL
eukprot:TRINITY_DN21370_c0_g1_i1.p1 TRINITY_DN21370_c0_g1~~TRINITY_DN21370_c0_g1_i1.p1  ORF type:complete len:528 (-),score=124.25 TRINITY_DN21370_c0_g1_i1:255-1838(-)